MALLAAVGHVPAADHAAGDGWQAREALVHYVDALIPVGQLLEVAEPLTARAHKLGLAALAEVVVDLLELLPLHLGLLLGKLARLARGAHHAEDAQRPHRGRRVGLAHVGARVLQLDVGDLEQPGVVRLDHREALVGHHPLSARGQDGAELVRAAGSVIGQARRVGVVGEAPDDGVVLELLGHARHEGVLAEQGRDWLIAGAAAQVWQAFWRASRALLVGRTEGERQK